MSVASLDHGGFPEELACVLERAKLPVEIGRADEQKPAGRNYWTADPLAGLKRRELAQDNAECPLKQLGKAQQTILIW